MSAKRGLRDAWKRFSISSSVLPQDSCKAPGFMQRLQEAAHRKQRRLLSQAMGAQRKQTLRLRCFVADRIHSGGLFIHTQDVATTATQDRIAQAALKTVESRWIIPPVQQLPTGYPGKQPYGFCGRVSGTKFGKFVLQTKHRIPRKTRMVNTRCVRAHV